MKTTIEIAGPLLRDARAVAARDGTTLKALVEEGLLMAIERRKKRKRFKLPDATFRGRGPHPDLGEWSWDKVRDMIYEGHGS